MKNNIEKGVMRALIGFFALLIFVLSPYALQAADDLLPTWNEGTAKQSIVKFVTEATTKKDSASFDYHFYQI